MMDKKWRYRITPKTGLFDVPFLELWRYRGMIYMLVKRNYQIQYKQTILGPAWMILGIIFSSGLFSFVFGYVGQFSSDGIPYFLFYMSASILWNFFAACLESNAGIFLENAYLFGKVYFPRMVVPAANVCFELIRFSIQLCVCMAVWLFYFIRGEVAFTGGYLLMAPVLVLEAAMLGMAFGMLVSSLTTRYRDLSHVTRLGMQLLMYASPVLYPVSQLSPDLQKVILLNPVSPMIEAFRYCLTGSGMIHWGALFYSMGITGLLLVGSVVLFNQTEKTFIDIV